MKQIFLLLFVMISSFAWGQKKYGWVPTGISDQMWKSDIFLDSAKNGKLIKIDGFVKYIQKKYVPEPGEPGGDIRRPTIWVKDPAETAYDANMKIIKYRISYVKSKEPKSLTIHQQ